MFAALSNRCFVEVSSPGCWSQYPGLCTNHSEKSLGTYLRLDDLIRAVRFPPLRFFLAVPALACRGGVPAVFLGRRLRRAGGVTEVPFTAGDFFWVCPAPAAEGPAEIASADSTCVVKP
jgi:hypothetical protein